MWLFRLTNYIAVLAFLTGCGFQPLYGRTENFDIGSELASVEISVIEHRIGQQLRNFLLDRINPTGPLHHGHAWGAVLGSALVNVLVASGYSVTAEYYVNDAGSQMDSFYRSIYVRYLQALGGKVKLPKDGYQGDYIIDAVEKIISAKNDPGIGGRFTSFKMSENGRTSE